MSKCHKCQSVQERVIVSECQRARITKSQSSKESKCQRRKVSENHSVKVSQCQSIRENTLTL